MSEVSSRIYVCASNTYAVKYIKLCLCSKTIFKKIVIQITNCRWDYVSVYCCYCINSISTNVFCVGKPGSPEGPLNITDISADSCKLSWNPPKNSGGAPVTNYIVEKMDVEDGNWKPITKFCRAETYNVPDLVKGK